MTLVLLALACSVPVVKPVEDSASPDTGAPDSRPADDSGGETAQDTDSGAEAEAAEGLSVSVHPEVSTVLVVRWTQLVEAEASWLSWSFEGRAWSSPERARSPGPASEVVLGLPSGESVELVLNLRIGDEIRSYDVGTGTTGGLPAALVLPSLTSADEALAREQPFLLTSVNVGSVDFYGPCYVVIIDQQARVVWYRAVDDSRLTMFPRVSRYGGYLIWDATTYYVYDDSVTAGVIRATLDLGQEEETTVPHMGLTYDELPDGSLLFDYAEDYYRYHLAIQAPDGEQTLIWDCYDWMSDYDGSGWACAPNTVLWDEESDQVIWSMFQTSTVASIELSSGELQWYFGRTPGGLVVDPADALLMLQHYPNWTPDGTLLLSTHVPGGPGQQTVREYEVDATARTATQVWSYTPEAGHYADYAGEATRLESGNTLVNFGTDGVVQEVTPEGEVAWEIDWQDRLLGHLTPIENLYDLNVGW